jgi:O-antigen/teichoic acid export membrane protein
MGFGALIKAELVGAVVSLVLLWPLAIELGDYRVMLFALLTDQVLRCVATHVYATETFKLGWDGVIVKRALTFGLPLMLAGVLNFTVMQADRIIVAYQFTAIDLGLFSAALTLAMTPTLICSRIAQSYFLPILSKIQDDDKAFETQSLLTMQMMLCFGGFAMLCFSLVGANIFGTAFGERMTGGIQYVVPLGIAFSVRLIRTSSTVSIALARGHTFNPMFANLIRLVTLPVAIFAVHQGASIVEIVLISMVGEVVSLLVALFLLQYRMRLNAPRKMVLSFTIGAVFLAISAASVLSPAPQFWFNVSASIVFIGMVFSCTALRKTAMHQARTRLKNRRGA